MPYTNTTIANRTMGKKLQKEGRKILQKVRKILKKKYVAKNLPHKEEKEKEKKTLTKGK